MKTIEYKVTYNGGIIDGPATDEGVEDEIVKVKARDINSGLSKAVKLANQPLGNGKRREIHMIEFWQVVS